MPRSWLIPWVLVALAGGGRAGAQEFWDRRPRQGGEVALGAGYLGASVSGGAQSVDGARGSGLQLVLEWRISERFALDLRLGGFWTRLEAPAEINYPADDGDYSLGLAGLHYDIASGAAGALWVGFEVALHYAQMKSYAYSLGGFGYGPALGADVALGGPLALRLGLHLSWVRLESSSSESFGKSRLTAATVDLLYVFR